MSLIVLYFLNSTSVLFFYIDVVLTLSNTKNKSALVQVMSWHRSGDKPLHDRCWPTYICGTEEGCVGVGLGGLGRGGVYGCGVVGLGLWGVEGLWGGGGGGVEGLGGWGFGGWGWGVGVGVGGWGWGGGWGGGGGVGGLSELLTPFCCFRSRKHVRWRHDMVTIGPFLGRMCWESTGATTNGFPAKRSSDEKSFGGYFIVSLGQIMNKQLNDWRNETL